MSEKSKPLFEHVTCSRCGGSGNFSFNLMHGSRCYGCNGSGYKLTKKGFAAQKFLDDLRSATVSDLKVGDLIWFDLYTTRCYERITNIEPDTRNPGHIKITAIHTKTGERIGFFAFPNSTVRRGFSSEEKKEQREKALAYQATLTKAGTPRKRAV